MSGEPCQCFAHAGGNWNNGANDGLFYWNLNNDSSNANTNIGSRLLMVMNNHARYFPWRLPKISHKQVELVGNEKSIDDHKKMKRFLEAKD